MGEYPDMFEIIEIRSEHQFKFEISRITCMYYDIIIHV